MWGWYQGKQRCTQGEERLETTSSGSNGAVAVHRGMGKGVGGRKQTGWDKASAEEGHSRLTLLT